MHGLNPGLNAWIEPKSPKLQAPSLPAGPPRKPFFFWQNKISLSLFFIYIISCITISCFYLLHYYNILIKGFYCKNIWFLYVYREDRQCKLLQDINRVSRYKFCAIDIDNLIKNGSTTSMSYEEENFLKITV